MKATAKIYKPYLLFFISFCILSLSHSFLCLSLSSLASSTSLHTYIYLPFLRTVRFPFTVKHSVVFYHSRSSYPRRMKRSQNLKGLSIIFYQSHSLYEMLKKLEWLINHILSFLQSIHKTFTKLEWLVNYILSVSQSV